MIQLELGLKARRTLEERFSQGVPRWHVSSRLFGDVGADIWDFMDENYVYFLNHVKSRNDLLEGLLELSPLADDALTVAEKMTRFDFELFKAGLQMGTALIRMPQFESQSI